MSDELTTLSIAVPSDPGNRYGKILTMNGLNNLHFAVYAKTREYWREHFKREALRGTWFRDMMVAGTSSYFAWCDITVDHIVPTRRNVDVAACLPCIKAGIDGLCNWTDDRGVVRPMLLPDDKPEYVHSLKFNAPEYQKGIEALVITLRGEKA